MKELEQRVRYSRETIEHDVIEIIVGMMRDWDDDFSGALNGQTRLISDLNFPSIDIAMLVAEIHRFYQRKHIPFERVFLSNGLPVQDIQISALVDFLYEYLND
jgi:acyl carrier protein